jgi:uncharacterized membrane protein YdjX (TVP38/TMEM64 family)
MGPGVIMVDPLELAADVVTGATALAGLILVYLGMVVSGFAGFQREQQATVRAAHQLRAWFAFVGMTLAIVAAVLALIGKWAHRVRR